MIKFFDCGGYDDNLWGSSYTHIHSKTMEKLAGACFIPPELTSMISQIKPRPEGRYVLLNALGAHEYWGCNSNGDTFPEWSLKGGPPPKDVVDFVNNSVKPLIPDYCVPSDRTYGGPSFVTGAKVYQNHINKDPTIACGDVIAQAYNDQMHRVELIVFVYEQRAPDIVKMIDAGEAVPWSMGAKLKFDVCSICSKVSRNRGEYCSHLATQLKQFLPDGRKVFSYNYFPMFFDISKVTMPADRSAWMLKKVASAQIMDKQSSLEKREIVAPSEQKNLGSAPVDPKLIRFIMSSCGPIDEPLDPQMAALKQEFAPSDIVRNMMMLGMMPSPAELEHFTNNDPNQVPGKLDLVNPNRRLIMILSTKVPDRSLIDPHFTKRAARSRSGAKLRKTAVLSKFANLLSSLDYNKLVHTIENNPTVRLALDNQALESAMFKSASNKAASWLPFVVVCSQFNGVMK